MPPKPSAAASRSVPTGKTSSSSHWRANGNIFSSANARAVSLIARCSSVSSKSTRRPIATAHWTVNLPAWGGGTTPRPSEAECRDRYHELPHARRDRSARQPRARRRLSRHWKLVNALLLVVDDVSDRGRNRFRRLIDVLHDGLHRLA